MNIGREIKRIIIHHTLTSDGMTVNWQAIRRYHVHNNGWRDIGYHFGVELVKSDYEVLVGRPLDIVGAHTKCLNTDSIGIALVGNFDIAPPKERMISVLLDRILVPLMVYFDIPVEMVQGHREAPIVLKYEGRGGYCLKHNRKSCPGWHFSMKSLREILIWKGFPVRDKKLLTILNNFDEKILSRKNIAFVDSFLSHV